MTHRPTKKNANHSTHFNVLVLVVMCLSFLFSLLRSAARHVRLAKPALSPAQRAVLGEFDASLEAGLVPVSSPATGSVRTGKHLQVLAPGLDQSATLLGNRPLFIVV